ncbi:hypothetical protein QOZ80_2BG0158340 [Eleusine coracana subsp. coracana]|nr:hypothetical protein QOZ80_2BG0158340 [Eleusine coracana subsp. coracana]
MEVRHLEKFLSVHDVMKQAQGNKRNKSATSSQDEPAPTSSMPAVERPPGRKQAKQKHKKKEGEDEYVEVLGRFVQMKTDEQKKRDERWKLEKELEERKLSIEECRLQWDLENKSNRELEERKLFIEECRLQWEKEQKIMFCDVSTMDESQKVYVLNLREEIARQKVTSLKSSVGAATSCASEHGSGGG